MTESAPNGEDAMSGSTRKTGRIDRRTLLRYGAGGAAAAALAGPAAKLARAETATSIPAFELEEIPIAELQARLQSGRETSRSLTEKYLARIEALDRSGPGLRAVLETNPEALAIADALDRGAEGRQGRAARCTAFRFS